MSSIVLMNLGGPSTLDDVRPFLKSLFSDPMIIELPGGRILRPLFARAISSIRGPKVRGYYARIGGGSPLLPLTREQAAGLEVELARRGLAGNPVRIAMRYTAPDSEEVVTALRDAGERRAIALPLYPQECVATTGSSLDALERARDRIAPDLEIVAIRSYHLHPGYLAAIVERIREALASLGEEGRRDALLLFSAHGVPESLPRRGDPYVGQIRETVEAVVRLLALPNAYRVAFQSRTGPVRWVGPGTDEVIEELAGHPCVLVVPIAFVSDHIETLYEIDILFRDLAAKARIGRFARVGALNGSPRFMRALADLVEPFLRGDGVIFDCVVIGGGIAGLSSAAEILRLAPGTSLLLLESEGRLGGNIRTTREDGFTIEWGVNGFLDNVPETLALIERIGLREAVAPAGDAAGKRFIFRSGTLHEVPMKPPAFLASSLLSVGGRLRVLGEPFARRRPEGDETVFAFAARRIGREAATILVDAMVSGVYAGDSRLLSLESTFPRMAEMEREHGSLVRALIARRRQAGRAARTGGPAGPAGVLTSLRDGMESLVDRLAERIGPERIRMQAPVLSVERDAGGYAARANAERIRARRLVVAAPAKGAARFLRTLDVTLAEELDGISYAGVAVVALAYRTEELPLPPDGFGFLAPRGEGLRVLGCLWDSSIFVERAPSGWTLMRAMIGGAQDPEAVRLDDASLIETVRCDLRTSMGIAAPPRAQWIFRHPLGIPQYTVGHGRRLQRISESLGRLPGLYLAGNSYRGVAINNCVREAAELAERWEGAGG